MHNIVKINLKKDISDSLHLRHPIMAVIPRSHLTLLNRLVTGEENIIFIYIWITLKTITHLQPAKDANAHRVFIIFKKTPFCSGFWFDEAARGRIS